MNKIYYIPNDKKLLSITFDDGPCDNTTLIILNILKEHNIKATFFMLCDNALKYPNIVKRIISEGHHIGIHSYSHTSLRHYTKNKIYHYIKQCLEIFKTNFGVEPIYFRPPFGTFIPDAQEVAKEFNLTPVGWTVMVRDWMRKFVSLKAAEIISKSSSGKIIVLHDGYRQLKHDGVTVDILKYIIPVLLNQEYSFVLIPDLIKAKSELPTPTFSETPLLHHEIIHLTYRTALFLYWDVNFVNNTKTFTVKINNQEIVKNFPDPHAMKEWPLEIEFPLKTITKDTDVFIKDDNGVFVKL